MTAPLLLPAREARCRANPSRAGGTRLHELRTLADTTTVPSLLILGADAVLAAQPASPVQLAHACHSAGYDVVVPASLGEELIAERVLARLRGETKPMVQCSCPCVARRLAAHAEPIGSMLIRVLPPPIALARHLRAAYAPRQCELTFAGSCPAAADDSIDRWLTPPELMARLEQQGVSLSAQPTAFDSVLPPDRRRHWSEPGGLPFRAAANDIGFNIVEILSDDFVPDLAERLLAHTRTLLDIAIPAGCHCSGAATTVAPNRARAAVRELEPPRVGVPVISVTSSDALDDRTPLAVAAPLPSVETPDPAVFVESRASTSGAGQLTVVEPLPAVGRRSPPGGARPVLGSMPRGRTDAGRQLPRAYIARRRSSPRGLRLDQSIAAQARRDSRPKPVLRPVYLWIGVGGVIAGLALGLLLRFVR